MHESFKIYFVIIYIGIHSTAFAQDAHYWSEQFGNKSMLLGGTVNASVHDLGLVFYNPGRLAQIENPAFVLSAKVYEYTKTTVEDGIGEGKDLSESNFGGAPSLIAGTFKVPFLKGHSFAYSFLTRFRNNGGFDVRATAPEDELAENTKYTELSAKIGSKNSFSEEWYGLTWSNNLNEILSVGVSTFGYLSQSDGRLELQMQGLTKTDSVDMLNYNRELNFSTFGFLWKAGLAAEFNKINLGLTITTPKINVSGNGTTLYEDFVTGIDSLAGKAINDVYIENYQEDLPANLNSSWAVGLGIGIKLPNTVIHLSSEWFDKVDAYTIMEADEFIGQQPEDTINFRLVDELASVINFGIGLEHSFSKKIDAYASFATDFSAVSSDASAIYEFDRDEISNSQFDGDIFHFAGGVSLNLSWAELTLGASHGASDRTIKRPLNLGGDVILDPDANSKLHYSRWRFIVGFSFPFAGNITEKVGLDL